MTIATHAQPRFGSKTIPGVFDKCEQQDVPATVTYGATYPIVETICASRTVGVINGSVSNVQF